VVNSEQANLTNSSAMQQEIFNFHKAERLNWNDFIESDENHDAILCLAKWPEWNSNGIIIHGESGTGKTHLAALWSQSADAIYVLKESLKHSPRDLFDAENNFVIDNFEDFIDSNYDWMFHFLNIIKEKNRFFLLLSRLHPSLWNIELEDLRSRLLAMPAIGISAYQDDMLLKVSQKIAKDLEITIPDDAVKYILNTTERRISSIANILKKLDKLSLQQKKPLSLAYVKNNLKTLNIASEL
jgi:chromosomal replication initiation ATPase DnaA